MSFFTCFVLATALSAICGVVLADNVTSGSAQSGSLAASSSNSSALNPPVDHVPVTPDYDDVYIG